MRLSNKAQIGVLVREITTAGTPEHLGGYIVGDTISFATNVISDSGSGFLAKNFQSGDKITVSGSTSNDGDYEVVTAAAGTLTLGSGVVLTTELASATVTITETARKDDRQEVDDGINLVIRAHPDNTGALYYAGSETDIADSTKRGTLYANQSVGFQVKNYRAIWCDVGTSLEKVEMVQEK